MAEKYQSREERRKQLAAQNHKKNVKKKRKFSFKRLFLVLVTLGIIGMIGGAATFAYMVKDAPKLTEAALKDPIPSTIYDVNNEPIREVGSERRDYVEYKDIPPIVRDAFLATEDARFFKHNGVDIIRLGGAVLSNITNGFGSEGASTITQQVVKMAMLSPDKNLKRKAQEAWLAVQLEKQYSKEKIFEMYVNKIYMSEGVHGVATAAKVYFNKPLKDLTLQEAALLAGMPQAPNAYNPFDHPDKATERRNIVLSLMKQHGFITNQQMAEAKNADVTASLTKPEARASKDKPYQTFVDYVMNELEKQGDYNIYADGLKIYTTIDKDAQTYVDKVLNSNEVINYPDEKFQAGITLLDTKTGEIRALGGGRNQEKIERGFSFATDAYRQPGSTFKPILDYGPAIEYLKWGTYHALEDKPTTYTGGTPVYNWDRTYMGTMTMREALARSRNIPAIATLKEVGLDKAKEFANNLGIPLKEVYESYAIGGLDKGVNTLQMAGAYSAFGNDGIYTAPHTIRKIKLTDGTTIDMTPESKVVMKDYTAFMITDMLKSVLKQPYGTGGEANIPSLHVAGKTGTTDYDQKDKLANNIPDGAVKDAWFVGYTTNYTAAVWTGYDKTTNYIDPGPDQKIAQQIFKNVMSHVSEKVNTPDFKVPSSVTPVKIEKGTFPAKLASPFTPSDLVSYEYAVRGSGPTEVSQKYDKLEAPSNVSAKYDEKTDEIVVSWDHNSKTDENSKEPIQFEVSASLDEGPMQTLTVTSDKSFKIAKPAPGGIYKFTITAVKGTQKSDPASASIEIPGKIDEDKEKDPNNNGGSDPNTDNPNNNGNPNPGNKPEKPTKPGKPDNGSNPGDNGGDGTGSNTGGTDNGSGTPPADGGSDGGQP